MAKDNNTINGFYFRKVNGQMKIYPKKYSWHIPKRVRGENIEKGDIVLVVSNEKPCKVLVVDVFREEIEDTGKRYKPVLRGLEKASINK